MLVCDRMDILIPEDDFNAALWKRFHEGKIRNVYPRSKYNDILNKIKISEEKPPCNSPEEYYLLRKFVVAKVGQKERLVCKGEPGTGGNGSTEDTMSKVRFYVALEEIYDFIDKAHKTTKHGGRDKIVRILHQQGIVNITRDTVELFLSFCQICRPKRKELSRRFNSRNVTQPATSADLVNNDSISVIDAAPGDQHSNVNKDIVKTEVDMVDVQHHIAQNIPDFTRAQISILDFTSAPDGDYQFIMVYQDYQTFFCILRPLKCKCTYEVVVHLLDIFTLIGAPQILYSDCDAHFLSSVIHELKCSWPDCVVVSGSERFRNAELQNNAEKYISEVHEMLRTWMVENNSARWSFGLKLVQFKKNTKIAENNSRSPYDAFFGRPVHTGVPSDLNISLLANVQKEDDLRSVVNSQKTSEPEEYEHLQVSLDPNICSLVQSNSVLNGSCSDAQLTQGDKMKDNISIKIEPIDDPEESHSDRMIASEALAELSDTSIKRAEIVMKLEPQDTC